MPKRVQLKRTKGWKMPPNTASVARPTKFGNPFKVVPGYMAVTAVFDFRLWIYEPLQADLRETARKELRGKNLACWCPPDQACHVDVLLELANR